MNDQKLKKLFAAARQEPPVAPTEGFDLLVMQSLRSGLGDREVAGVELLDAWFPRLAWAAAAVIVLCVAGDFTASAPGLTDGVQALSQQWLLNGGGI